LVTYFCSFGWLDTESACDIHIHVPFNTLMIFVGQQEGHLACKTVRSNNYEKFKVKNAFLERNKNKDRLRNRGIVTYEN